MAEQKPAVDASAEVDVDSSIAVLKRTPYKILMLVHDRPIYVYMTLDSLRRSTYLPYRLTVIHHRDLPGLMDHVLQAFQRRKIIHNLVEMYGDFVDWARLMGVVQNCLQADDEFIFYIEDDVVIEKSDTCWIEAMVRAMHGNPKLAFVGSAIDKSDFIDPDALAIELGHSLTSQELAIIKADSPERTQSFEPGHQLFSGHNVPGRFFCLRVSAMTDDLPNIDSNIDARLRSEGWQTAVLTTVRHRHMSLHNYYDYPDYYAKRNKHIDRLAH